ncbi:MAG: calcium/sodium antiporter [Pseudomonadota bacterium]
MTFVLIIGGLIGLAIGGELLLRGSVTVARRAGLSELIIGLTLVGCGTSIPELVTTLQATGTGATGIAVGNVVGSNIANILLVLGLAALLYPVVTNPRALARDCSAMVALTVVFCALVYFDLFTRATGIGLVVFLAAYLTLSVVLDRRGDTPPGQLHTAEGETLAAPNSLVLGAVMALAGIASVVLGARFLVEGAVILARSLGLTETVIGLTLVAIGTSLPELATTVVAALRQRSDVAIGSVIGSNIFNLSGIIGTAAAVTPFSMLAEVQAASPPLAVDPDTGLQSRLEQGVAEVPILGLEHIGALLLATFLMILFGVTGRRFSRAEGLVLLLAYSAYIGLLFEFLPTPFKGAAAWVSGYELVWVAAGAAGLALVFALGLRGIDKERDAK